VEDANIFDGNTLVDKVKINLNMLGVLMLDGVGGEVGHADVVIVDQGGPLREAVQLHKQLMKAACLRHAIGHDMIFHLNTRMRDDDLAL
jgi:nucleoside-triphosphatase THEP1